MSTRPLSGTTRFSLNGRCQTHWVKRVQHGISWLWQSFLSVRGRMPQRGHKFVSDLCFNNVFNVWMFFCWFLYDRNRATPVIITWILKCCQIETWVNYVDGFYLGVWFHPSKTKCGQHCLKGWHLPDLLDEHALHAGTSVRIPKAKFWYGLPRWQVVFGFQFSNREDRLATLHSDVRRRATALTDGWNWGSWIPSTISPRPRILLESGCALQEWNFAPCEKVNFWAKEKRACKDLCHILILLQVTIGHRIT